MAQSVLTDTLGDLSAPRARLFAGDEWIADDFVAALASVFGESANFVGLYGAR